MAWKRILAAVACLFLIAGCGGGEKYQDQALDADSIEVSDESMEVETEVEEADVVEEMTEGADDPETKEMGFFDTIKYGLEMDGSGEGGEEEEQEEVYVESTPAHTPKSPGASTPSSPRSSSAKEPLRVGRSGLAKAAASDLRK